MSFMEIKYGFGECTITPKPGVPLAGYNNRSGVSSSVHDPLYARVAILGQQHNWIVLVSCDMIAITPAITYAVRNHLFHRFGVLPERTIVAATHTHSGPICGRISEQPKDRTKATEGEQVADQVTRGIVQAADTAFYSVRPAHMSAATSKIEGIGKNRFFECDQASAIATVLLMETDDSRDKLVVVNYACHPTILGADNLEISADYPGVLCDAITKRITGAKAMFFNGAAGDISTRYRRIEQTFFEVSRLGHQLAAQLYDIVGACLSVSSWPLRALRHEIELPCRKIPNSREIDDLIAQLERKLASAYQQRDSTVSFRDAEVKLIGARSLKDKLEQMSHVPTTVRTELQVLRIGDIAIIGIPGELFSSLGEEIRMKSPAKHTLIVGYANDCVGYILSQEAARLQRYESINRILSEKAGYLVLSAAESALQELFGSCR
jgi:neutral ceramidase